jgi:hypothetical protein
MRRFTNTCIIGRNDNVVVVDFTRRREPPTPRFPGASGLRENAAEEVPLRLGRGVDGGLASA